MTDRKPVRVFVTYSHDDDAHKTRVRGLAERLIVDGGILRKLAANPGTSLCIISSRQAIADLDAFEGKTTRTESLESLSTRAGATLLESLGVRGTTTEREKAAAEFGGHALALSLLGRYLADACDGDVLRRREIGPLLGLPTSGGHAKRVMDSYEAWLGPRERALLGVVGLFDRPASGEAIGALLQPPAIADLTESLVGLRIADFKLTVAALRRARLLVDADSGESDTLDAHPLVREHFGESLRTRQPAAWRAANGRLFEHYKAIGKPLPQTLDEMAPLYAAIAHGCRAGRHQAALDEVYWPRVVRGTREQPQFFSTDKLGAYSSDLAALAGFFDEPWIRPTSALSDADQSWITGEAGFSLRALGRIREAAAPTRQSVVRHLAARDWKNASIRAGNVSELLLALGDLAQALAAAEESVKHADCSGDLFERMEQRTAQADVLHQMGRFAEAQGLFRETEAMHPDEPGKQPFLRALQGYRFCDLLLDTGHADDARRRAAQMLRGRMDSDALLTVGLEHLALGRAATLLADPDDARVHIDTAIEGLRRAGSQDYIPRGLLARADLFVSVGDFSAARADLDETDEIAARCSLRLHECDVQLGYARLALALDDPDSARECAERARRLVAHCGYHRRDGALAALTSQLLVRY